MFTPTEFTVRELDHRVNDGIDVSLLWNARTNQIAVAVRDERSGEAFEVCVAGGRALDAFRHPYAYAHAAPIRRAGRRAAAQRPGMS